MALTCGTKLGPYEIVELLGAGGMGEVYRARDTRLDRNVAVKVLPPTLSADSDRLRRFEQEARSASALNHPNIITIYELGHDGATHYIAMELVEGRTVRELLYSGMLPLRKAIEIAAQAADGLTKAHEAGITHRDLKPENLMVTEDGFVKILDFGLAKLTLPSGELSDSNTTVAWHTRPGLVMGTMQYMAPEQVSGSRADFRTDQFSFGLVLYEMVTGKIAFQKSTTAETLVAILREQALPIGVQNPEAPAPLCWVIERCLAKEADKRYVSTRELARELAAIRDRFSEKPVRQVETRPTNLPVQRTGFVGREREVDAAKDLLLRPEVRLLTITGPGGIGKTRLAVEVASGLVECFPGGIHFIPLSSLSDPGLIASAIVQTLGIREAGGQSPLEILRESLRDSLRAPMLLVLDNFEHLMEGAATVADLLVMGPNVKILVTSRAALHVYGEHEFPVAPLALPDSRSMPAPDVLSQCPAVALFVQRAVAAKPDFELNRENAPAVAEICARLDGLPLAIELAAARVKVLSPASLLARLANRLQLLTGGARDLPQRQQTLRGAMDWSYDLLSADEQMLFRRLAVFVGGCNLEGVEAVCDARDDLNLDLLDGMASMVDKSLVKQIESATGESRFVMLETIREYALEKLEASGEKALTKRAHAAYCLVLAEEDAKGQSGEQAVSGLERLTMEHENFRAALEWLTENGDADWGLRLGTALFRFWEVREYLAEGRDSLGKVLKLAGAAAPTKARARALFSAGVFAVEQGDFVSADALIGESRDIARQLGDTHGVAVSLNAMAVNARDQGDIVQANSLFEESLAVWRKLGDQMAVARSLSNLASVVKLQGEYDRARALYAECLSIFKDLGDKTGVAWSINYQGDVARDQCDSQSARTLYEQSLAMFRELGDRWGVAGTLADLGTLAREEGNYPEANACYRESIRMFQEMDHKRGVARLLECFACCAAVQLEPERSLRLAGAAAAIRQTIGAPLTPSEQAKLESSLHPARESLTNTAGVTAWLEGWALPVERAIEEVMPKASSGSVRANRTNSESS
ncbi:MAG TPA: tetratricopeptide repeat protein [Terriglobales bacterium]|jgi:predicted ATPase|nr:tetratricopeptide repeat protein [Terriglobales bacterium]